MLAQRIPEPIRARLRPFVLPTLERARTMRWLLRERMLWGGRRREQLLVQLLRAHYASLFRRQWSRAERMPHFFDHRIGSFGLFAGDNTPFGYYRGYYAAEVLRDGDVLLDIGCGDGFFASRFFAPRCSAVDAIDIEPSAIRHALAHNAHPRVAYSIRDAVDQPFPRERYDAVVWDGALGHFAPETTHRMLAKIRDALAPAGVFVGSETLGTEGHDHLQFFTSIDDLGDLLGQHFAHVEVRAQRFPLKSGVERTEAYWRCALDPERLELAGWRSYGTTN
jgi:SAM-dependent methyltransferase